MDEVFSLKKGGGVNFRNYKIKGDMLSNDNYRYNVRFGKRTNFDPCHISFKKYLQFPFLGGTLDSRNFHLGCPVVYGNKWIANKWVHWIPQMWNYPCYVNKEPFPVYSNWNTQQFYDIITCSMWSMSSQVILDLIMKKSSNCIYK